MAEMTQLNAEIPVWLNEIIGETAVRLRQGKSGWKSFWVTAAMVEFLKLSESQQRSKVLAAQDLQALENQLRSLLAKRLHRPPDDTRPGRTNK